MLVRRYRISDAVLYFGTDAHQQNYAGMKSNYFRLESELNFTRTAVLLNLYNIKGLPTNMIVNILVGVCKYSGIYSLEK